MVTPERIWRRRERMATARDIIERAAERATQVKIVSVPTWEMNITIRRVSMADVQSIRTAEGLTQLQATKKLFVLSVVDPVFTEAEVDELWATETAAVLTEVVTAINEFNTTVDVVNLNGHLVSTEDAIAHSFQVHPNGRAELPEDVGVPDSAGTVHDGSRVEATA